MICDLTSLTTANNQSLGNKIRLHYKKLGRIICKFNKKMYLCTHR